MSILLEFTKSDRTNLYKSTENFIEKGLDKRMQMLYNYFSKSNLHHRIHSGKEDALCRYGGRI